MKLYEDHVIISGFVSAKNPAQCPVVLVFVFLERLRTRRFTLGCSKRVTTWRST